jgi:hypothetical protein
MYTLNQQQQQQQQQLGYNRFVEPNKYFVFDVTDLKLVEQFNEKSPASLNQVASSSVKHHSFE